MPSCFHGFISDVLNVYLASSPKKVLDIGVGFGKWGSLFREYGDIFRGRYYKQDWEVQIDGIEAFPDYSNPIYNFVYNTVHFNDVKVIYKDFAGYDFVYAGDVIEHLDKPDALAVLDFFKQNSKILVVSIPLTDAWPQSAILGNDYEQHRSIWDENDFAGYEKIIKKNPRGKPIGLFIHKQ